MPSVSSVTDVDEEGASIGNVDTCTAIAQVWTGLHCYTYAECDAFVYDLLISTSILLRAAGLPQTTPQGCSSGLIETDFVLVSTHRGEQQCSSENAS